MKLYTVASQYVKALNELIDSDLPAEAVEDTLEGLKGEVENKARNLGAWIKNKKLEVEAMKSYIDEMAYRKSKLETHIQRLETYLINSLDDCEITDINDPEVQIKIRHKPPRVKINNEDIVPVQYMRVIPETEEPDRKAISEALKRGVNVAGCELEHGLRIEVK